MPARAVALVAVALAVPVLLAGCGGSSPKPDPAREARLVGQANALCRSLTSTSPALTAVQRGVAIKRLRALAPALRDAVAYLPAGREWAKARAELRMLNKELDELKARRVHGLGGKELDEAKRLGRDPITLLDRFYRAHLQSYDSEQQLGLAACAGRPPRPPIAG